MSSTLAVENTKTNKKTQPYTGAQRERERDMAMPQPPAALVYDYTNNGNPPAQYQLFSSKMMVAAIIVLFIVVFIILFLHIYAKWFWRSRSSSAMMTSRRLQRLHFIGGQEANYPAAAPHNIGLDKSAIDRLPAFIYKKAPTAEGETEEGLAFLECSVCLTEFEENDKGRLLPTCKHSFHTDCIDMWLYSHSTCPLCRAVVTPTPLSVITVEQQLQEQQQGEELQRGGAEDAPPSTPLFTAHEGISIPSTINHGNAIQYPSNVLFWGSHTQVMASEGSFSTSQRLQERPSSSSSSSSPTTRAIPQITIEIPGRQDMNLSSPSSNDQGGSPSQPIKSPGLRRMSFKRILSSKVN